MNTGIRLTLEDYEDMVATGMFDGRWRRRVEFIRGEIREMSPIGPAHDWVVSYLTRWSTDHLPAAVGDVRIQSSLRVPSLESVPEPDVVWYRPGSYRKRHPQAEDVQLLIEVADSSLAYDRGEKAGLYAAAGIAEY
ncbi:MAG: Uma2 family endonuclease [Planctomycetales bacterium]